MWHKCDKWDQVDPYRMPKRYVFQFFMNRHFHFSKFIHIFHDFSTFAFAWTSSKNLNNLSVRPTSKQGKGLGVLVRTRIWTIPMKITAIRVIKLPPIMLNLQPSSIWKLIEICSAPFRIKLLFLTFMWSQMTANRTVRTSGLRFLKLSGLQILIPDDEDADVLWSPDYLISIPCIAVKMP